MTSAIDDTSKQVEVNVPAVLMCEQQVTGVNARQIIQTAASVFDVTTDDILGPFRYKRIMTARRACVAIMVTRLKWSYARTARALNRNHTTIISTIHRYREVDDLDFLEKVLMVAERFEKPPPVPARTPLAETMHPLVPTPPAVIIEEIPAPAPTNKWSCIGAVYVEARIPNEWDAAFLKALRRAHPHGYGGLDVRNEIDRGEACKAQRPAAIAVEVEA